MKNTEKLAKEIKNKHTSIGTAIGIVKSTTPCSVAIGNINLIEHDRLTVLRNVGALRADDRVLILFSNDNEKAFVLGAI